MKVILCGYNWAACEALSLLVERGYEVFVYTHEVKNGDTNLIDYCKELGIKYTTNKISVGNLPFLPDVISSVYYSYIINREVIEQVKGKIFNVHPSLLPSYRGCSSVTWAMVNGDTKYGYTYHYIDEGCDTGNIILQKEIELKPFDTQLNAYQRIMFSLVDDYLDALDLVRNGELGNKQQGEGTSFKRGAPYNGIIDPKWQEEKIKNFIRAMTNPPLPYARYNNNEIRNFEEYKNISGKTNDE